MPRARVGDVADPAAFQGFPTWGVTFYQDLEADNTKEFWTSHKADWERQVRDPMRALVEELEPEFGPATIFRPYRDIRFSADKSPYKTYQGAIAGEAAGIGYYVQLSGEGLTVGGGFHTHSPAQTDRYRQAVDDDESGTALETITAALVAAGYALEGAALKTRPKGYDADHPRLDLLRRKEMMGIKRVGTPAWLSRPAALDHIREAWQDIRPLNDWVLAHVGPAEEHPRPGRRR
jgi:uncharacterized protein (TIGR02453 family)